jgi:N,N'-diacetyllegionaminate synthase
MLRKLELSEAQHRDLKDALRPIGIEFFSTPFSLPAVDLLVGLGVRRMKMPSGELTHRALVEHASATSLPLLCLDRHGHAGRGARGAGLGDRRARHR